MSITLFAFLFLIPFFMTGASKPELDHARLEARNNDLRRTWHFGRTRPRERP